MIDIAQLRNDDIGRWVEYYGPAGVTERGRLKRWNDTYIFVVYKCGGEWDRFQDFTAAGTNPVYLSFADTRCKTMKWIKRVGLAIKSFWYRFWHENPYCRW